MIFYTQNNATVKYFGFGYFHLDVGFGVVEHWWYLLEAEVVNPATEWVE